MAGIIRRPCVKCNQGKGIATCNGCQQILCIKHFTEHRDELSKLMDNVSEEHDFLQGGICQENVEHPLLFRIDHWEQESIKKIQVAAQTARTKLQKIYNRNKQQIKSSLEQLTTELQISRDSADYTEIDINRWTDQLKALKEKLKDWSAVDLRDDNHPDSIIHLINIYDQEDEQTPGAGHNNEIVEEPHDWGEKFDRQESDVDLSEDNLVATYVSNTRRLFSYGFVYGINRYSTGTHSIRFLVEKKGTGTLFFGVITATKKYDQSFFHPTNSSVYGWYNLECAVISGRSQSHVEEHTLVNGDELILFLDCDKQQIFLEHQRTERVHQIPVKLDKCPFPWKILIGLPNFNDCVHILP